MNDQYDIGGYTRWTGKILIRTPAFCIALATAGIISYYVIKADMCLALFLANEYMSKENPPALLTFFFGSPKRFLIILILVELSLFVTLITIFRRIRQPLLKLLCYVTYRDLIKQLEEGVRDGRYPPFCAGPSAKQMVIISILSFLFFLLYLVLILFDIC